jgi:hypothetical protein
MQVTSSNISFQVPVGQKRFFFQQTSAPEKQLEVSFQKPLIHR